MKELTPIYSHTIREDWEISILGESLLTVLAKVVFYSDLAPDKSLLEDYVGSTDISTDENMVSVFTCKFSSHYPGQKLAQELGARSFMMMQEITNLLGFHPAWAYVYYFLSDADVDRGITESDTPLLFRHLGFRPFEEVIKENSNDPTLLGISQTDKGRHLMRLSDCVSLSQEHWKEWLYQNRVEACGLDWEKVRKTTDWEKRNSGFDSQTKHSAGFS